MTVSPIAYRWLLALIVGLQTLLLCDSVIKHSPTIDEGGHLLSGLVYWKTGRFNLYLVNPPLAKLWATWPLLFTDVVVPVRVQPGYDHQWKADHDEFLERNKQRYAWLILISRLSMVSVSVAGLLAVAALGKSLFGPASGLLSGLLWATNPNILAWGAIANTDVAAATAGVIAIYGVTLWVKDPKLGKSIAVGALFGIAQLTKFSLLLLFPATGVFLLGMIVSARIGGQPRRPPTTVHMLVALVVALLVVNAGYLFHSPASRLADLPLHSSALSWLKDSAPALRLPLPDNYLVGIDEQQSHADAGYSMYFRGHWHPQGFWYYYLYAGAIKEPLPLWIACAVVVLSLAISQGPRLTWCTDGVLLAPLAMFYLILSSQVGMNLHYRYALPATALLIVFAGRSVAIRSGRSASKTFVSAMLVVCFWSASVGLMSHPHHLGYFNEIVGGSAHGKSHLAGSNVDWGQDLYFLRDWLGDQYGDAGLGLAYFGPLDPAVLGISYCFPGTYLGMNCHERDTDCGFCRPSIRYVAISAGLLCGSREMAQTPTGGIIMEENSLAAWNRKRPKTILGSSIYLFELE